MRVLYNPHTREEIKLKLTHSRDVVSEGEVFHLEGVRFMLLTEIADAIGISIHQLTIEKRTENTIDLYFRY